ncbi:GntR family transcriptional regulator [Mesorhizobium sp. BH1-1-4]|uniref:GntR family transcriptional regulator n=1 Tax=Mesorhizobium sp. BH1-1-4 TaxID=2876662 RepID=UPI001CD0E717|nr:GntR family transcriptional regulator [Mesorhizobium sp. BH1-1-4]MBZ9994004.1 GntR family transcriptional regulator [Mesorhizobium sp. BH1-1-4]
MEKNVDKDDGSLAESVATRVRNLLIAGEFEPSQKLSEHQVAAQFGISRNTLREVFRLLTSQRLLEYIPNRGVFVAAPDEAAVIDIYRVRLVIQRSAVQGAVKGHPALAKMRDEAEKGQELSFEQDWRQVGTTNMEFHRAMVELHDSARLSASFDLVLAELRLVFGQLEDSAHLHEPYIERNSALVQFLESGDIASATSGIESYLLQSERAVLAALQRKRAAFKKLAV